MSKSNNSNSNNMITQQEYNEASEFARTYSKEELLRMVDKTKKQVEMYELALSIQKLS